MTLNRLNLKDKLEPFIYEKLDKDEYDVLEKNPVELLTWNRLDLAFRIFYLDYKNKYKKMAVQVYYEVIRSQTLGTFKEFGNEHKSNFNEFIKSFNQTYFDIKDNGFSTEKTIIPLSEDGTIINGAHRVSSSLHLNKNVYCVKTNSKKMIADYRYFYERNVSEDVLDLVTQKFIEYAENTYIAFLWPSGKGSKNEAENKFSNIVYKKKIILTPNGAFNLLYELYKHMDWVGDKSNEYKGIQQKLIECFPIFEPFTIIVFQAESLEKVREIKEEVRKIYNIGFSSIHITDTKEEAIRISRLILNKNGIHFLNYAKPNKIDFIKNELSEFKNFIANNNIDSSEILIDSSFILSLYGLREAKDIDYLVDDNNKIKILKNNYNEHDSELKYHESSKSKLLYDQAFYFWFDGIKFISFNQLYKMKKNRGEEKDKNDCKMMEALIENNVLKKSIGQIKQSIFYFKIKIKHLLFTQIITILKFTKTYDLIRLTYKYIKRKF